jgi:2-iminobutanoate/2-iminopropanoate deaminase
MDDDRKVIHTDQAPAAVGPYSQAVRAGGLIFTAGQIALDPATGAMVDDGIEDQTRQALRNLQAVLEAAGSGLAGVLKTTVYLTDMSAFAAMNAVYAEFFASSPPARSAVEVAALPKGALFEIECVALAG